MTDKDIKHPTCDTCMHFADPIYKNDKCPIFMAAAEYVIGFSNIYEKEFYCESYEENA